MAYGDRLENGADSPLSLLNRLKIILEHSHNAYTFRYRCRGQQVIIERMPDGSIEAYYADGRDGRVTLDTARKPFDKIVKWS